MAKGDLIRNALRKRITESAIKLQVTYPAARPVVNTGAPTTAPVSPLTGPRPTQTLIPYSVPAAAEEIPDIPCLWLDAIATTLLLREYVDSKSPIGWKQGAEAVARVLVEQTARAADKPYGGTIFDGAEVVICHGKRWKVMAVEPISSGFNTPFTYAVWLKGAAID